MHGTTVGGEGISLPFVSRELNEGIAENAANEENHLATAEITGAASASGGVPESKDDNDDLAMDALGADDEIFAMEGAGITPARLPSHSIEGRVATRDDAILLLREIFRNEQYDLLKLVLFPQESINDLEPHLLIKPRKEAVLKFRWERFLVANVFKVIKKIIRMTKAKSDDQITGRTVLKTNKDIDNAFRAYIAENATNQEDIYDLKALDEGYELWRKLQPGNLPGENTAIDNEALEAYYKKYKQAFTGWITAIYEYFIDPTKNFETNIECLQKLLELQDYFGQENEFRAKIIQKSGRFLDSEYYRKSQGLSMRLSELALDVNCTYSSNIAYVGLLDPIDSMGNTVLHFLLSHLNVARNREFGASKVQEDATKELIRLLPIELFRMLNRADAPLYTAESVLALSNSRRESIEMLATECGDDILNLIKQQCQVGRITGELLIEPVGIIKTSILAKVINRGGASYLTDEAIESANSGEAVSPGYGTADIARAPRSPGLNSDASATQTPSPIISIAGSSAGESRHVTEAGVAAATRRLNFTAPESAASGASAGAGVGSMAIISAASPGTLARITPTKAQLHDKMLLEATTDPWNPEAPDLSLLPPYNTPEKRTHLAFFGISAKSKVILETLLTLHELREKSALTPAVATGTGAGIGAEPREEPNVRQLYTLNVEIEYQAYLFNLWQMDMSIAFYELMFEELQRGEKTNTINSMKDLISIRDRALRLVSKNAPKSFFELDRYRRCLWTLVDDQGNEQYDLAIMPVLQAYTEAFVLWESKSNAGLIDLNQRFEIVSASLRDLNKLIFMYRGLYIDLEITQSAKVKSFYKAVSASLSEMITRNPKLFKTVVPDIMDEHADALQQKQLRTAELFKIDPNDPASVMRFSHIVTHQVPFDARDKYRNNFLHWAYLCGNYHASDWLVKKLMKGAITGTHDNPLIRMENMFGEGPKSIVEMFPDVSFLSVLYKAAKATSTRNYNQRQSAEGNAGAARPFSPVEFDTPEQTTIYENLQAVMDQIPFLCEYLLEIEKFLLDYEDNVITEKENEARLFREGDLLTQLKWNLWALAGYDKAAILEHRKRAMTKLEGFKLWVVNNIRYLKITRAEQLRGDVIGEIVRRAEVLNKEINEILRENGITSGTFSQALNSASAKITKVTRKYNQMRRELAAQALRATPRDEAGMALVSTNVIYESAKEYVDNALIAANQALAREAAARAAEYEARAKAEKEAADAKFKASEEKAKASEEKAKENEEKAKAAEAQIVAVKRELEREKMDLLAMLEESNKAQAKLAAQMADMQKMVALLQANTVARGSAPEVAAAFLDTKKGGGEAGLHPAPRG